MPDRIDDIDEWLEDWITERLDVSTVSFDPPGEESSARGVSVFLRQLVDAPPPRTTEPTPLQVILQYLVTTWAETPQGAHRILGDLVFEAMQTEEFDLELAGPVDTFWTSLDIPPRPSFFIRMPFRRERPRPDARMVEQPLVLETTQVRPMAGRIVGPEDVPIAGASVEFPAFNTRTKTDRKGRFRFEAVPTQSEPERLIVRAKGTTSETRVDLAENDGDLLTIRIQPEG